MRLRRVSLALSITGAVALFVTGCAGAAGPAGSPAAASPTSTAVTQAVPLGSAVVHGTGTAAPFDKDQLQDLRTLATNSGTPFARVLAGQRGAAELDALTDALDADPSSGMVTAGHDPDHPGTAWMSFTVRPDAELMARIALLPLDTTVRWGLPLGHEQLSDYTAAVIGSLRGIPSVQALSSAPTALGDGIVLTYAVRHGRTAPTRAQLEAAVLAATTRWSTDGTLRVPVRFVVGSMADIATAV